LERPTRQAHLRAPATWEQHTLYLSNPSNPSQPTLIVFQPAIADGELFGYGVAVVPFSSGNPPLLLVGANYATVGGVSAAGQVYVYKKN